MRPLTIAIIATATTAIMIGYLALEQTLASKQVSEEQQVDSHSLSLLHIAFKGFNISLSVS